MIVLRIFENKKEMLVKLHIYALCSFCIGMIFAVIFLCTFAPTFQLVWSYHDMDMT